MSAERTQNEHERSAPPNRNGVESAESTQTSVSTNELRSERGRARERESEGRGGGGGDEVDQSDE